MIEATMFLALGFFSATLIGLMILPALSRRADRLARRRAEAAFPLSLEQVAADRDHLRAELALRERALERRFEDASAARASALEGTGRKDVEIAARNRTIEERNDRIENLAGNLSQMTAMRDLTAASLKTEEENHITVQGERSKARAEIERLDQQLREHTEEMGTLNRRREGLEQDLAGLRSEQAALESQLANLLISLKAVEDVRDNFKHALSDEQGKMSHAAGDISRLGKELGAANTALAKAETKNKSLSATIMARDTEQTHLKSQIAGEQTKIEQYARDKAALEQGVAKLRAEKAALNLRIEGLFSNINVLNAERDNLKTEVTAEKAHVQNIMNDKNLIEQAFMARGQELDAERRLATAHIDERDMARSGIAETRRKREELERALLESERRIQRLQAELQRDQSSLGDKLRLAEDKTAAAHAARKTSDKAFLELREERSRLKAEVAQLRREAALIDSTIRSENSALQQQIMDVANTMLGSRNGQLRAQNPVFQAENSTLIPTLIAKIIPRSGAAQHNAPSAVQDQNTPSAEQKITTSPTRNALS